MKARILVRLRMFLGCLLLVGVIPQMARAQEDTTIVIDTLYSTPEIDGNIWYSEYYSTWFVVTTVAGHGPGDAWDVIVGGENYERAYLSFDLTPLPDSIIVIEATVNLYQFRSGGNNTLGMYPIWDVPGGDTLFCIMDHINYGTYLDILDWGAGDPGHPKTLTSNIGVLSDNATVEYKSLDVAPYVQADIDAGRIRSQFRIRFPINTDQDGRTDELYFKSSSTSTTFKPHMPVRYKEHNAVKEWGDYSLPVEFRLEQNFPNPFNENTVIRYSLLVDRPCPTTLKIYNILGKEVRSLLNKEQRAGRYEVVWDGRDNQRKEVRSGIYIYLLRAGAFSEARRMVLIR